MSCNCCGQRLNSGMIHKKHSSGRKFKSCPHCSEANGGEHIFHPYPASFGQTPARVSKRNPDGDQSYCIECRALETGEGSKSFMNGELCSNLI